MQAQAWPPRAILAPDLKAGVRLAEETIDSGAARAKLEAFVLATNAFD
jgi:anthranilate phosphoribosyltransferase